MNLKKLYFLLSFLLLPLVSAYNGYGAPFSVERIFQNQTAIFGLIFLAFFALIFFTLNKTIKNKVIAAILSIIISLFISFAISQRTSFYGYLGEKVGAWLLILALIIALIVIIRLIISLLHGFGLFLSIGGLWLLLRNINPRKYFPYEFFTSEFFQIWKFITGEIFIIIIGAIFVSLLFLAHKKDNIGKVKDWMWGEEGKTTFEKLMKSRS